MFITVTAGILITLALYWFTFALIRKLPQKAEKRVTPYAFIAPVLFLISSFIIYPAIQTIKLSFMDAWSTEWVGLDNYIYIVTDKEFLITITNNFLWIAVVPISSLIIGLAMAVFSNEVGPVRERVFKSIVFIPMAISFVSAASIWSFAYAYRPDGGDQIGMFNAFWTWLGNEPVAWMATSEFKLNSLLMMVVVLWGSAGFATVLLSAAIKSVPEETTEAAKIDGANTRQIFFRITLPQIRSTALAVFVTSAIGVMKIFDIVYAMTAGNNGTNVLGMAFIRQYFAYNEAGRASAVVVILMILIIPVMIYQVHSNRKQEELR